MNIASTATTTAAPRFPQAVREGREWVAAMQRTVAGMVDRGVTSGTDLLEAIDLGNGAVNRLSDHTNVAHREYARVTTATRDVLAAVSALQRAHEDIRAIDNGRAQEFELKDIASANGYLLNALRALKS